MCGFNIHCAVASSQVQEAVSQPQEDSSSAAAEPKQDGKSVTDGLSASDDPKKVNMNDIFMKLPQTDLHNLCSLLGHEGLSDKVYLLTGEVLKKLASVASSHRKFFIVELSDLAHSLSGLTFPPGAFPMPIEPYETHTYAEVMTRIQGLVGHPPNNFTLDYQRYGWGRRAPLRTRTDWDLLVSPVVNLPPVVNPSVGPIPANISNGEDEFDSEESNEEERVEFTKFQTGIGEPHGGVRRGGGRRGRGLGGAALAERGKAVGGVLPSRTTPPTASPLTG
uniref:E3 ubiquitin-protein ligase UPL1-like n=1 Tax=Tanacetum cinerariifolium TaxID=118510 RepID=A0A6L2KEQ7_TANCI|nr:E3 ubiquitin-protein ligase UPL1-like [Tanacetum cinerariifolium]